MKPESDHHILGKMSSYSQPRFPKGHYPQCSPSNESRPLCPHFPPGVTMW